MYKLAIRRPITTLMGAMIFIIFGIISYRTMPINLFPNVDFPVISIQTVYNGADAAAIESKVTDKIEEAVSGIDGIKKLTSTSYNNFSSVVVQFKLKKNLDEAANDVRDKVSSAVLPKDAYKPIIKKLGAGGGVISLFVSTNNGNTRDLMKLANEKLKPRLQRIMGVADVNILGYRSREIRIFLNPDKLNSYDITAYELRSIIASNNIAQSSGKIITDSQKIVLKTEADAKSINQLKNLIVKPGVKLSDVAIVTDGLSDPQSYSELSNKQGVMLEVKKISGENTLNIINSVKKILPTLNAIAGKNYDIHLSNDRSSKILVNMDNVTFDLIYGSLLSIIIVFLFLRSSTATLISAIAIPVSVIGTFAIINWLGYNLNRLTMIGLTLAIGIFIDDAIVVVENITKKMEAGEKALKASFDGVSEIAFSILAISSVLLAVFIPVAFMDGIVGLFFNSFAMTVASGIVISFFVATMLIPSLGARILKAKQSKFYYLTEPAFKLLDKVYVSILKPLLRFKYITLLVTVGVLVASTQLKVGMDFIPVEDNNEFRVIIKAPLGNSIQETKREVYPLVKELESDKRVVYTILSIGYNAAKEPNKAKIYVKLLPSEKRIASQSDISKEYRRKFSHIKNMDITVEKIPLFATGASNAPVQVIITGSSLDKLGEISAQLMTKMKKTKGLTDIGRDYEKGNPEIDIKILRAKANRAGVSVQTISAILSSAYSSDIAVSHYQDDGKEYDITMRLDNKYLKSIDTIKKLMVRNNSGKLIPLDGLIKIVHIKKLSSINRYDRERKVMVTAGLDGVSLDKEMSEITKILKSILPVGYSYHFAGDIENMQDTANAFAKAVMLAIILIYIILAALYESLIQPIIIMVAMPLSFTGVLLALYLSGYHFSLFVMIAIIMLLGMVGKNAILVVDYANRAIKDGLTLDNAILKAGEKRLRPILMTTFAMIGAMIPLAFGGGAGHEGNAPMAVAIIGGLISSTILTLLIVPAVYKILYPLDRWLRKWYER